MRNEQNDIWFHYRIRLYPVIAAQIAQVAQTMLAIHSGQTTKATCAAVMKYSLRINRPKDAMKFMRPPRER